MHFVRYFAPPPPNDLEQNIPSQPILINPLTAKFFFCFNLLYFDRFTSHHNKNQAYFQTAMLHCSKS